MRAFGGHGHGDHIYKKIKSDSTNTSAKIPSDDDYEHQLTDKPLPNDRFLAWVNGKFPMDRLDNKLLNDKANKYSAYYQLEHRSIFHN